MKTTFGISATMSGAGAAMPPRWGLEWFLGVAFYKHVAPLGLGFAHRPPGEILKVLGQLEAEIQQGMKELEGMLK
jgi:hypothetical protein